jgi:hypothetical protein
VLRPLLRRGHLDFCPLRYEVGEDQQLDRLSRAEFDVELSKLHQLLDDTVVGVMVADDISYGKWQRTHDLVGLEVVPKLSRCD